MWNWFCCYLLYPLVALIFGQSRIIFGFSCILQSSKGMRWKTSVLRQHLTCVLEIVTTTMCQAYLSLSILETKITPCLEKEFRIFDGGLSSTWKRSKGEFGKSSAILALLLARECKTLKDYFWVITYGNRFPSLWNVYKSVLQNGHRVGWGNVVFLVLKI